MAHQKFDVAKLEKLNDEGRFETLVPEVMWKALRIEDAATVVEIGAGTGLFAARFLQMASGATMYAVDIEPVMVEWMRENRPEVAQGRLVPLLSSETGIPLEDGVADAVLMINLHHELVDPAGSYKEAHRLLRRGGRLLVADWAPRATPRGPSLHVRVSGEALRRFLEAAGFGDVAFDEGALPWHTLATATKL